MQGLPATTSNGDLAHRQSAKLPFHHIRRGGGYRARHTALCSWTLAVWHAAHYWVLQLGCSAVSTPLAFHCELSDSYSFQQVGHCVCRGRKSFLRVAGRESEGREAESKRGGAGAAERASRQAKRSSARAHALLEHMGFKYRVNGKWTGRTRATDSRRAARGCPDTLTAHSQAELCQ